MMRRVLVAVVGLLLSGLLPLAASARICVTKRCCKSTHQTVSLSQNRACCATVACNPGGRDVATTKATTTVAQPRIAAAVVSVATPPVAPRVPARAIALDTGPPSTRLRLATLSILLV